MKFDYLIFWSEKAEAKLLDKADYIFHDSKNEMIIRRGKFLNTMRSFAEKLRYVAALTLTVIFISIR